MLYIITMKRIYTYQSYKKYIKDVSEFYGRGSIAKLSEAAGCNRTYLSQCLSTKVQLTPDHIMGIADYLNLSEDEQDYFLQMLLLDRSASKTIQSKIKKKMDKMIQSDLVLSKKISQKKDSRELSESEKTKYYSSWKYAVIHSLVSIRDFQTPTSISKKMRLSESEIATALKDLNEMGLITYANGHWSHSGQNIHIPTGSSYTTLNHLNWRLKSVEDVNNKSSVHYTTVFSLSKKDWESLRQKLIDFIEKQRNDIHSSGSEELYCFCCDLFQPLE